MPNFNAKTINSLLRGQTGLTQLTIEQIRDENGGLPEHSYSIVDTYTGHHAFRNACNANGYEVEGLFDPTGRAMGSSEIFPLGDCMGYVVKLRQVAFLETAQTHYNSTAATQTRALASVNYVNYNGEYGYTPELLAMQSQSLDIDYNGNKPIVKITNANEALITSIISPAYPPRAELVYRGSCAVNGGVFPWADIVHVHDLVKQINIDNSTRAPERSVEQIVAFILNPANSFSNRVQAGDVDLVDELTNFIKEHGGRREKSLASKVCKYANLYYGKTDYFINDLFVRSMLPYYLDYYSIPHHLNSRVVRDNLPYRVLHEYLLQISHITGLNPNCVDRIIWGSYKSYAAKG